MDDRTVFKRVEKSWNEIGKEKCSKYLGTLTTEVIRHALQENGIPTSGRDVFIRGIPIEFDLIIPRQGANCLEGILYDPEDVIAVLEIKTSGLFDYNSIERIEHCRNKVQEANSSIFYGYVTLTERQSFYNKIFGKNIPDWVFTLSWCKRVKGIEYCEEIKDSWQKLLSELHKCIDAR